MGERQVIPEQAKAIARALAAADSREGSTGEWEIWLPFASAVYEAFPHDHVVISKREWKTLTHDSSRANPDRSAILEAVVKAARALLVEFLDPTARAIALGELAAQLRTLDRYDWKHEERNGR